MRKIYTSIDLGSDTVKMVTAEHYKDKVNVLAAKSIKSKGIRKGLITDPNLAVNTIKDLLKEMNEELGIELKKVIVNIPDYNIEFMYVTGEIEINGIIDTISINRVLKESAYNKIQEDYELITVIPLDFVIDGKENNPYPAEKECQKLEVKGIMITVPKKNLYSVISVIEGAGLEIADITISGLSDYYEVRNDDLDNKIGAIINIGHETTKVSIINHGIIMNTETIQLGGSNIEKDISYVFGVNIIDARKIKEKFASAHKRFINLNEIYELKNNIDEDIKLNQLEVTEVVMSRLNEILDYAKKQILLLTKKDIEYIIITGGQTEIKSFKNLVYEKLGKDVIIYMLQEIGIRDNKFTSALGEIKYFVEKMKIRNKEYSMISEEDETLLITPSERRKKEKMGVPNIFKNFMKNKEDTYE